MYMAAANGAEWALEELGVRRVSLPVADIDASAVLAAAAETLGADVRALARLLAAASEMGRAREPEAGLVAFREGADRVVVLSNAAMRSEGLLWAGVAHELGNALTTIGGWASVAASTLDEAASRKAIAMVAESAREAMDVAPLLLEGGGDGDSSEAARVVSDVTERFAPVAAARGVTLSLGRVDPGPVTASRAAVAAITANLVKNAIEACREGGRVEIGVRGTARVLEIVVDDDGRGMPESARRALSDAGSTPREGSARGRGLGLSIVHALVERVGGKARATSAAGAGSSVRVQLPRAKAVKQSSGVRQRAGVRRVLVVEDHAAIAELLETAIEARGAATFHTRDPAAGLRAARSEPFDLALVDLDLGTTRGEGLIEALAREKLARRVVVMSGAPSVEVRAAHGVLRKPFDLTDLDEHFELAAGVRRAPSHSARGAVRGR